MSFILIEQFNFKVTVDTPETELPPSLPQPETSEEKVDTNLDSTDNKVPDITATEQEDKPEDNEGSPAPSSSPPATPAASPSHPATPTPVPSPASDPNGVPEQGSASANSETMLPYINGGIINKRGSYTDSLVSENLDLSLHKESISLPSRVSQQSGSVLPEYPPSPHLQH